MTNIVEKLRMRSALSRDRGWHVGKHEDADTDDEAADKIERLRAALQEIAGHKISGVIPDDYNVRSWTLHNYVEIREIARAVLEGEKSDD